MNKADKEIEIISWMTKQGYDRRAAKDVAPIIVQYLEQHRANTPVIKSGCDVCDFDDLKWNNKTVAAYCPNCKTVKQTDV